MGSSIEGAGGGAARAGKGRSATSATSAAAAHQGQGPAPASERCRVHIGEVPAGGRGGARGRARGGRGPALRAGGVAGDGGAPRPACAGRPDGRSDVEGAAGSAAAAPVDGTG